jgi:hypothetical protein
MLDYPFVFVRKVEVHPVSEVLDYLSPEASEAKIACERAFGGELPETKLSLQGINRTPELAAAYESEPVQKYFQAIKIQEGTVIRSRDLLPQLEPDRYFKGAYPLPGTRLYLTLSEADPRQGHGVSQVICCCKGPNLGSAGGPTLLHLAALASIHYDGRY